MRKLYGSTNWRRLLALVLVFAMLFSAMGTSGYSVFADSQDETGEAVDAAEPEVVTPDVTEDIQGPSPGEDAEEAAEAPELTEDAEAEAAEEESEETVEAEAEEGEEPEESEAVEEGEEIAEPAEEAGEDKEIAEPVEEAGENEEIAEPAEEAGEDEEIAEPAEEVEEGEDVAEPAEAEEGEEIAEPVAEPVEAEEPAVPAEEAEEAEIEYPAMGFYDIIRGVSVNVEAPKGAFPKGTDMKLSEVEIESIIDAVSDAVEGNIVKIKAVDITFFYEGAEIQPLLPINVKMNAFGMSADSERQVLHIDDEGEASVLEGADTSKKTVEFEADSFSVYVLVESEVPRLKVTFMNGSANGVVVYVKDADTTADILNIVNEPTVEGVGTNEVFRGWVTDLDHTEPSDLMTIAKVRADIEERANALDQEDQSVTYYAAIFKQYKVTYVDGTEKAVVVGIKTEEVIRSKTEVSHTVNMSFTTDDSHNHMGWIVKAGGDNIVGYPNNTTVMETNDGDVKYYPNGTTLTIKGPVTFEPYAPKGHWLVFNENGKGGKYNAPQFVLTDKNTKRPVPDSEMTRYGYVFEGWYLESDIKEYHGVPTDGDLSAKQDAHKYVYIPSQDAEDAFDQFEFGGPLEENITVYANWKPKETGKFTVMCWLQDEKSIGKVTKTYDLKEAFVDDEGPIGEFIQYTVIPNTDEAYAVVTMSDGAKEIHYPGFSLADRSKNLQVEITPEGNAVLNLYFDRIEYNLKFYLYRQSANGQREYATQSNAGKNVWNVARQWTSIGANDVPRIDPISTHTFGTGSESVDGYTGYYFTLKAFYGEDIAAKWPTYDEIKGPNNDSVKPVSFIMMNGTGLKNNGLDDNGYGDGRDTVKGTITVLDKQILGKTNDANGNFLIIRYASYNNWTYHIYYETYEGQDLTGKTTVTLDLTKKTYYLDHDVLARSSNTYPANQNPPQYQGYAVVESSPGTEYYDNYGPAGTQQGNITGRNVYLNYYYDRLTYPVSYFDGQYVDGDGNKIQNNGSNLLKTSAGIGQGTTIPDDVKNYTPDLPDGEEGYVFEGWFADSACMNPAVFSSMPIGGIRVFAKWRLIEYRIFLRPNFPEGLTVETVSNLIGSEPLWGKANQALTFRRPYGSKASLPEGKIPGYEFYGWYLDKDGTQLFSESTVFKENDFLKPYDKDASENFTDPMDQFGQGATWNSDVRDDDGNERLRPWITKKLDLYGKWGKVLIGATGINVTYITTEEGIESSVPTDPASYLDNTDAAALNAATPVDSANKAFDRWVLQRWTGSEFVDTSIKVLPGETFTVLATNAKITSAEDETVIVPLANVEKGKNYIYTVQLKATFKDIEKAKPTHINWYKNDGTTDTYRVDENIQINVGVKIFGLGTGENIPSRDGYTFKGWTKNQNSPTADFLVWTGSEYQDIKGNKATLVAADENQENGGYDDLYAVWDESKVTINYAVASDSTDMGTVALNKEGSTETSENVYAFSGKHEDDSAIYGGKATAASDYVFDYWTCDEDTEAIPNAAATFVPTKNDESGAYEAHTYYAHFKAAEGSVTVHHYLKGTNTPVAEDVTANPAIGGNYTATPVTAPYQGLTLTFDSYAPSQTITVSADAAANVITVYYTLPLTIEAATGSKVYDGQPLAGLYTITGALAADKAGIQAAVGNAPTVTDVTEPPVNYLTAAQQAEITNIPGYYKVTYTPGTLSVTARPVKFSGKSETRDYTGSTITINGLDVTPTSEGKGLVSGHTHNVVFSASGINSGNYDGTITAKDDVVIMNGNDNVTANYAIEIENGSLTIKQGESLTLTVALEGASYVYDADEHSLPAAATTNAASGKTTIEYSKDGRNWTSDLSSLTATAVADSCTIKVRASNPNYANTATNEAALTITARPVTFTGESAEKPYTGKEIKLKGVTPSEGEKEGLVEGHEATVEYSVAGKEIGSYTGTITAADKVVIMAGEVDVTDNYDITTKPGTLKITGEGYVSIKKEVTSTPKNGDKYALGEEITYKITVKNEGQTVTINNIKVEDELVDKVWTIESLAPGATYEITDIKYTVTEEDILAGSVVNVGVISEGTPVPPDTPDNPPETPPFTPDPPIEVIVEVEAPRAGLSITKEAVSNPALSEGYALNETVKYQITVQNTGNVTLTNVTVTDTKLKKQTWTVGTYDEELETYTFAPGATYTLPEMDTTYIVAEADVTAGEIVNVATVTGKGPAVEGLDGVVTVYDPDPATDTETVPTTAKTPVKTLKVAFYTNYPDEVLEKGWVNEYSETKEVPTPYEVPGFVTVFDSSMIPDGFKTESWEVHKPAKASGGTNDVVNADESTVGENGMASTSSSSNGTRITEEPSDVDIIFYALWEEDYRFVPSGGTHPPKDPDPDPDDPDPDDDPDIDDPDVPLSPYEDEDEIPDEDTPFSDYEEEPDEELDEEPTPLSPYTGDDRHTAAWGFVSLLSLAGIAVLGRKRREEE